MQEMGEIIQIHKILYADYESVTFRLLAQKLLDLRFAGNVFAKRILNSIYGRLALEPAPTRVRFVWSTLLSQTDIKDDTMISIWRDLVILEQPVPQHCRVQNNKAIAAIITSRARCKLYKFGRLVGVEGELLYLDTDEIFLKPYNWVDFKFKYSHWTFYT